MSLPPDKETAAPLLGGSVIRYLLEARRRLLWWLASFLVIFFALFPVQNRVFDFIAMPMIRRLPAGSSMIATGVASPFMTPLKLVMMTALFLSIPILLYHVWRFVSPALYRSERRMFFPLLVMSVVLFYGGVAFAYFVMFPVAFTFLTAVAPAGVKVMTDINAYLDFVMTVFFGFGVAFEVPVAIVLAVWSGVTTPAKLGKWRPYAFVGAFVVGMILSPPEVISMIILSLPIYALYEGGIVMARILVPPRRTRARQQDVP